MNDWWNDPPDDDGEDDLPECPECGGPGEPEDESGLLLQCLDCGLRFPRPDSDEDE